MIGAPAPVAAPWSGTGAAAGREERSVPPPEPSRPPAPPSLPAGQEPVSASPPAQAASAAAARPDVWGRIVRAPGASPMVRAILTNSTLVELSAGQATISCGERFVRGARERLGEIGVLFERELGRRVEVRIAEPEPTGAGGGGDAPAERPAAGGESPVEDPLVKLAAELFGARIVAVTSRPRSVGSADNPG